MPSGACRLERECQNGAHQDFCSWREFQQVPDPPGVAFRLIRGSPHIYGLVAFQTVALALDSGVNVCAQAFKE